MLFLSKLIPVFVYPLGLALLIVVVGVLLGMLHPFFRLLPLAAAALLWVAAMPATAGWLEGIWVSEHAIAQRQDVPAAEAIVVLGGVIAPVAQEGDEPDVADGIDRVFHAARLYHAGKAPMVIASGGNLPWLEGAMPESAVMRDLLVELGVPREAIVLESRSQTTRENALNTAALMKERGIGRVLLVTSATHMRRAAAVFARAGIDAWPSATDFHLANWRDDTVLAYLPTANALMRTTDVLHEMLGYAVYRWRGWV